MSFYIGPGRWLHAEEVLDEEVVAFVLAVSLAYGVMGTRYYDKFEGFVGFDECVGDLHSAGGINIVVQLAYDEHQRTLETIGVFNVGTLYI